MNWGAGYSGTGLSDGPFYTTAVLRPSSYSLINPGYWPTGTGVETVPGLPSRDFTVGPKDGDNTLKYYTLTAYIDQKINEHMELELSGYRYSDSEVSKNFESRQRRCRHQQADAGRLTNPNYGQLYSDMFLDKQIQDHTPTSSAGSTTITSTRPCSTSRARLTIPT